MLKEQVCRVEAIDTAALKVDIEDSDLKSQMADFKPDAIFLGLIIGDIRLFYDSGMRYTNPRSTPGCRGN